MRQKRWPADAANVGSAEHYDAIMDYAAPHVMGQRDAELLTAEIRAGRDFGTYMLDQLAGRRVRAGELARILADLHGRIDRAALLFAELRDDVRRRVRRR